jgi:hypothetical protein
VGRLASAVLYGVMTLFVFVAIPYAYFYFEEYEEGRSTKQVNRQIHRQTG